MSMRSVRRYAAASEAARFTAVVVLPTPLFWFAMVRMRLMDPTSISGGSPSFVSFDKRYPSVFCRPGGRSGVNLPDPSDTCSTWNTWRRRGRDVPRGTRPTAGCFRPNETADRGDASGPLHAHLRPLAGTWPRAATRGEVGSARLWMRLRTAPGRSHAMPRELLERARYRERQVAIARAERESGSS